MRNNLPMTVDPAFWEAIANACSTTFADSYLSGADLYEGKLLPRTVTAWERLKDNGAARFEMERLGVKLVKPPAFQPGIDPARYKATEMAEVKRRH